MKNVLKKIKDCLRRYTADGSFTWCTRFFILVVAILTAYFSTPYISEMVISFYTGDLIEKDNTIFRSSVTIFIFVLIFGIGQWIIKTHDTKKQFKDNFDQRNETLYSNAIDLVTQEDKAKIVIGLMELTNLYDKNLIDRDRIKQTITRLPFAGIEWENVDLRGVYLSGANFTNMTLERVNFEGANLEGINFEGTTLRDINFQDAKLSNANLCKVYLIKGQLSGSTLMNAKLKDLCLIETSLSGVDLSNIDLKEITIGEISSQSEIRIPGSNLRVRKLPLEFSQSQKTKAMLNGAKYNVNTKFPDNINPEEYGMIRKS